jgi:hypothetical protein
MGDEGENASIAIPQAPRDRLAEDEAGCDKQKYPPIADGSVIDLFVTKI